MDWRDSAGLTEQEFLQQYRPGDYPRPSVAADIVILTVGQEREDNYRKLPEKALYLLLIRRGGHPFLGHWALPGGFVRPTETVGEAAERELEEETGVSGVYLEQLFTFSSPGRDPRMWVISSAHMALVDSEKTSLRAGDDADSADWFKVSYTPAPEQPSFPGSRSSLLSLTRGQDRLEALVSYTPGGPDSGFSILENRGLAFDHAKIIACTLERLRNKVEYTDIALNLMPPAFTLTELQQVYEVILGKPLLKAAFRRKIAPLVQETEAFVEGAGHRPSRLYRRKENAS